MCVCMVVFPCTNAYLYLCLYQYVSYLREDRRSYENENKTVRYSQIWASQEHTCQYRRYIRCGFYPWVRKIPWMRAWQSTQVFLPGESFGQRSLVGYSQQGHKNWAQLKRLSGEGNGTPLQYSCLENPMDRGAWKAVVHGVTKSQTRLSDFTFTFYFHDLEKEMATHSNVLAWRIPGVGEPGGLPFTGSHRHD